MPTALRSADGLIGPSSASSSKILLATAGSPRSSLTEKPFVVIKKKRLMRTTHSASLREQPNGWWI